MTQRPRIRLALVGAGVAAPPHLHSLHDLRDEVELAWVCTRGAQRADARPTWPASATHTTRLDDVLADTSVQAALVLTPAHTHADLVERLAAAGKHVLVEKPLDADLARAERMVASCARHGVQLGVVLQHRMSPAARALAALLADDGLGELLGASASVRWWRPQSYYDEPGRGTLARDGGGVLLTQAIHTLDLLLHLTGKPVRVTGLARTSPVHRMETEDQAAGVLQWAIGVVDATTAAWPGYPERISVNGTRGSATLEAGALRVLRPDAEPWVVGELQASGAGANLMGFDHAGHRAVLQDFLQAIAEHRAPLTDGHSALAAQQLIAAWLRSAQDGRPVDLP
jgi:UDP-N-acetyl-2-amino-2-deoxyglucuronate dehydrogenase